MNSQHHYVQEQSRLKETIREIEDQLSKIAPRYYGDDFLEQVLDAKREELRLRLTSLSNQPYFGRLDFQEQGREDALPLYIGKKGMDHADSGQPYIIDWRAPVASLFYSFTGGDDTVTYEAPEGELSGTIHLKRNLSIREQELQRVVDSYVRGEEDQLGVHDEFLIYRLGEKKDNRLRDIVSTIQAEQDQIIRAPRSQALIIQGAAGSGKTTVALHRLAFLLYQHPDRVRAERMVIFAPNRMFLDYISGVLPELGVGDIQQTTFIEWAMEQIGAEIPLVKQPLVERASSDALAPGRWKGARAYLTLIDEALQRYEATYLDSLEDLEVWDGCTLREAEIRQWFEVEYRHYALALRLERIGARILRWLEMKLANIGDPKIRKERSRTGKQKVRAYLKRLPDTAAFSFYMSLYGVGKHKELLEQEAIPATIRKLTQQALKKKCVYAEDLAPLVWIHRRLHGSTGSQLDHVVIDEAQDVSPFQIALLRSYMHEPSMTILGDLAQGIHAYKGVERWEEMSSLFQAEETAYHELRQSYRSTLEIIEFANKLIPHTQTGLPPAVPVFRSGEPVQLHRISDPRDQIERLRSCLEEGRAAGMHSFAIIGRSEEDCSRLYKALDESGIPCGLLSEDQRQYHGGVSVVPVHLSKGLEFDVVVVMDVDATRYTADAHDAKLLYVACTRALHRLVLLYTGSASPLIAGQE